MKKILLYLPLLAVAAVMLGCSPQAKWNHEQKRAMRESLRQYRDMAYLQDLTDPEFVVFSDDVAVDLENSYPVYTTFMQMDGVDDTVRMFVVTYPYRYLVSQGMLPDGLTHDQQTEFYKCLAQKVNGHYNTMNQFFNAILADTTDNSQLAQFQRQCANDLFNWVVEVEEVEVTEE